MTVERLRAVLSRVGPPGSDDAPVTPEEIAEILWLAAHMSGDVPEVPALRVEPAEDDEVTETPPPKEHAPENPAPSPVPGPVPVPKRRELRPSPAAPGDGRDATDVLVPTAPMLDHPLAVQRALRPLKRQVPDRRTRILDERATAARIADRPLGERPWVPVMTYAPERWLSLVLVVDDGPSMRLWRPLARELHETFVRLGAFRDLRVCHLTATEGGVGIATAHGGTPRDAATLIDPSGRQVVLVFSDCSGPHWWDGSAGRALHLWAKTGPAAILQPLTERLWRRTAAPPVPGSAVAVRACAPNTELRFTPYDGAGDTRTGAIPVPVLECSPDWLADWATLVAGGGARPAAMTYVSGRARREVRPLHQERELPIRERVQRFSMTASPEAARLAAHVAVSFPALPVMRLIQTRILGASRPGHLAEVLLSGLLRPIEETGGRYDFVPGAREALLAGLPRSESWHTADVLYRVSEEIERRAGTAAETFRAHLPADDGTGDHALGPDGRPFALVSGEAIRLLNRTPPPVDGPPVVRTAPAPRLSEDAVRFLRLLGISDPRDLDVDGLWGTRADATYLRVPIGEDEEGRPVLLNLREPAQGGMGAHGLCVGATGTGKSELLRTVVLALAAAHPPDELAMVLVDYKGGAAFAPFEDLPHVAGMITNLAEDVGLVERAVATLTGEIRRRQNLLRRAGYLADIGDYAELHRHEPHREEMPRLLVVVDEFAELLATRPEFLELFLSIGQVGRALGIHLLLASQRIEDRELTALQPHIGYRLGLRTFTEWQSRRLLNTTDAYRLPLSPGSGILKVASGTYRRFDAAYVSGPAFDGNDVVHGGERSLLRLLTARLARRGEPNRRIWLPPLADLVTLDQVCGVPETTDQGLRLPRPSSAPGLRPPLGVVDDPARHRQPVWALDLDSNGGHVAVVGSPQSGKTTLLRTLVTSLALTATPRQVAIYTVDLAGSAGLRPLGALPHVGEVAGSTDEGQVRRNAEEEQVRRTVEEVRAMLDQREQLFREQEITSVSQLRSMHAAGMLRELPSADVVLVVDGIGAVRGVFDELEGHLVHLIRRGGGYGIHVVASMLRRGDVNPALWSGFGATVELRLNEPSDSVIDRERAGNIRIDQPGRALIEGGLFAQVALPRVDGVASADDLAEAVRHTARAVRDAWPGDSAPSVRVLPRRLPEGDLPSTVREPHRVPIGVEETRLDPVHLDLFGRDRHLLVLGDDLCGKTNLLRLIARGLAERFPPEQLTFVVMDPRRGLRDVVPDAYIDGYAGDAEACAQIASYAVDRLRRPVTRLRQTVVLADDYEILTPGGRQPFAPFLPVLTNYAGLHFVVTRRVTGAGRDVSQIVAGQVTRAGLGLRDPFLSAMREDGATGLVMTGRRAEGPLLSGVYASPQPPGRGRWVRPGEPTRLVQTALVSADDQNLRMMLAVDVEVLPQASKREMADVRRDLRDVLNECERVMGGDDPWTRRPFGEGLLFEVPGDDLAGFAEGFPRILGQALRDHNAGRPAELRMRLRAALHYGPAGLSSMSRHEDLDTLAVLRDGLPLRRRLQKHPGTDVGLIMSITLHRRLAQQDPGLLDRLRLVPSSRPEQSARTGGFIYTELSPPGRSGPPEDA